MLEIRKATEADKPEIWKIIKSVISGGDTYPFAPDSGEEEMLAFWFGAGKWTYVAVWSEPPALAGGLNDESDGLNGKIVGTFFLKANQPGLGSHIANAGYMVASEAKGKRVGRRMAEFSLEEARRLGFRAMQFNFVVKSNEIAVRLWQDIGFEIIGEIPEAFQHKEHGLTNALIMYRKL
ncbi:MAG TPA: N-acetyltransferase [Pyrinomonadaceae bacterium]|jgi:ribosomal protein S18 acetylase RimI-like enzyme|nr:N-acetyltransferase [Pyrinomonadaceae bacterium]